MTTLTYSPDRVAPARRAEHRRPTFARLVAVEARKNFDTRAGWWLCASIVALSVIATGAVVIFAPDSEQRYGAYAQATGVPMAVILPILAILSVTSEWSQRSGLSTFTMVPQRGRVVAAKATVTAVVGIVAMVTAGAVGALGTVVGPAIAGVDPRWDISFTDFVSISIGSLCGMAVGFMLGVLIRNSPAAIVSYFVYSLVLPGLFGLLASVNAWYRDHQPWLDFAYSSNEFFEGMPDAHAWAQIGVSSLPWLVIPMVIGVWMTLRAEVK